MIRILATIVATLLLTPLVFASTALTYYTTDEGCEHPFIDIVDHWAEEQICFLYDQEVIEGKSERNYMPYEDVTRAEFLKISLLNLGYTVYAVQSAEFNDTYPGDWYYQYATYARSKGFVEGYDDGSFKPNSEITRAEAVVMIMDIAGITAYDTSGILNRYDDVSTSDWFGQAVAMATDLGIVEGYGDGSFRPYNDISRDEAAVIAHRVWEYLYE